MTSKEKIRDELLAIRCMRHEPGAYDALVKRWEAKLFYYLRRFVDDEQDAWDILQETFIKVIRSIGTLKDPKCVSSWLYSIARNAALTHIRKHKVELALRNDAMTVSIGEAAVDGVRWERADAVHRALGRLSLPHREILTLFFLEDFSQEEISAILDVPPGTVKSRLYYAKAAFKEAYDAGDVL